MSSPDADPASAARRLAALARTHGERDGYPHMADLVALLPILDAVAAGRDDAGRVERWARGLVAAQGLDPDYRITDKHDALWTYSQGSARAAMALADAERAAGCETGWAAYEEARYAFGEAVSAADASIERGDGLPGEISDKQNAAQAALDTTVRALACLETTKAPPG